MKFGLLLLASYLIGAIPFALIIGRVAKGIDIRQHGSGNVGATNVLRVVGKKAGIFCFLLDFLKGLLPTLAAKALLGEGGPLPAEVMWVAVGVMAVVGHCFPVYLMTFGGKGVATSVGVFVALLPLATGICVAVGITIIIATRYVAIGSCVGALLFPILVTVFPYPNQWLWIAIPIALMINLRHRTNWKRLFNGTEPKLGDKTKQNTEPGQAS